MRSMSPAGRKNPCASAHSVVCVRQSSGFSGRGLAEMVKGTVDSRALSSRRLCVLGSSHRDSTCSSGTQYTSASPKLPVEQHSMTRDMNVASRTNLNPAVVSRCRTASGRSRRYHLDLQMDFKPKRRQVRGATTRLCLLSRKPDRREGGSIRQAPQLHVCMGMMMSADATCLATVGHHGGIAKTAKTVLRILWQDRVRHQQLLRIRYLSSTAPNWRHTYWVLRMKASLPQYNRFNHSITTSKKEIKLCVHSGSQIEAKKVMAASALQRTTPIPALGPIMQRWTCAVIAAIRGNYLIQHVSS